MASQSFIKLTSYCDFCYVVMTKLSTCFLSFGEFEKADNLLDRSWKLLSRVDYYNFLDMHLLGEIFCIFVILINQFFTICLRNGKHLVLVSDSNIS